jgi:hypothetical protein
MGTFASARRYVLHSFATTQSQLTKKRVSRFMEISECPDCHGKKLKREALSVKFAGLDIRELSQLTLNELARHLRDAADTKPVPGDQQREKQSLPSGLHETFWHGSKRSRNWAWATCRWKVAPRRFLLASCNAYAWALRSGRNFSALSIFSMSPRLVCTLLIPGPYLAPWMNSMRRRWRSLIAKETAYEFFDLTVETAHEFFEGEAPILRALDALLQVGLGYLRLGQPATELLGW